jgi:hypothetical protein
VSLLHPLGTAPRTQGYSLTHPAIDWGAPVGTPVRAAEGGIVVAAGADSALPFSRDRSAGGGGIIVTIAHGPEVQTLYAHLSAVAVTLGQQVSRGAPIGFSGATGTVTGPHLHFMLWINGKAVDPTPYLDGVGLPGGGIPALRPDVPSGPPPALALGDVTPEAPEGTYLNVGGSGGGRCDVANGWRDASAIETLIRPELEGYCVRVTPGSVASGIWDGVAESLGDQLQSVLILGALLALAVIGLKLLARG